ncbi:hypothetical protein OVA10_24050 [Lelliottia sp. SL45]|uniref:hypothetical protein n=1 Tax=Lelliottia sp. SL45 TaxID=2994665 RepID=UPI0022729819|nr:hypothetical protein [Lelliottia sp. SL45]MCY1701077.1 hypothetical protein [Lelliottia sp. SL45]
MERVIFSVIFFMMLGVPFYLLYKIARDIFGTAGAGEPAQLPQGKQRRSGGAGSGSIWQGHHLQGSSHLNPLGSDCNGDNSIAGGCDGGGGGGDGGGGGGD